MSVKTVRRVAGDILKCGISRIKILDAKRAMEALTREDVKQLIKEKLIIKIQKTGVSRGAARKRQSRKRSGRGRGRGKMRGSAFASVSEKDMWQRKIRALRKVLGANEDRIPSSERRTFYRRIKGNLYASKKRLLDQIDIIAKKDGGAQKPKSEKQAPKADERTQKEGETEKT